MIQDFSSINILNVESSDWDEILSLLKESKMDFWMDKGQDHRGFYKILQDGNIIGCFALMSKNQDVILRHFVIRKCYQGMGYGRCFANILIPEFLNSKGFCKIYLLCDNKEPYVSFQFWRKTKYKMLKSDSSVPTFFQEYMDIDAREYPEYLDTRFAFCLELG